MNHRVNKAAVALLALSLSLNAPAFAAQSRRTPPNLFQRIVKVLKQVVKPLISVSQEDIDFPIPPRP